MSTFDLISDITELTEFWGDSEIPCDSNLHYDQSENEFSEGNSKELQDKIQFMKDRISSQSIELEGIQKKKMELLEEYNNSPIENNAENIFPFESLSRLTGLKIYSYKWISNCELDVKLEFPRGLILKILINPENSMIELIDGPCIFKEGSYLLSQLMGQIQEEIKEFNKHKQYNEISGFVSKVSKLLDDHTDTIYKE